MQILTKKRIVVSFSVLLVVVLVLVGLQKFTSNEGKLVKADSSLLELDKEGMKESHDKLKNNKEDGVEKDRDDRDGDEESDIDIKKDLKKKKEEEKKEAEKKEVSDKKKEEDKKVVEKKKVEKNKAEKKKEDAKKAAEKKKAADEAELKKKKAKEVVIKEENLKGDFMSKVSLNIRKGPSTEFGQVGVLAPGKKAVASAKTVYNGKTWYKVTYNGVTGWASKNYLVDYKKEEKVVNKENSSTNKSNNSSNYAPYTIYFSGKSVPYKQGGRERGQAIIDGGVYASTWGGVVNFSGNDGKNTHFIAHNPGKFTGMHTSKKFVITDGNGTPFTYHVDRVYKVDAYGKGVNDGVDYWDRIVGTGGGERVVLQSTYKHPVKWIVEATPR